MSYLPFYRGYLYNTLAEMHKDNVLHLEIRALCGKNGLGDLVDADGKIYSGDNVIDVYRDVLNRFNSRVTGNGFMTMKLIVSSLRSFDKDTIEDDVHEAYLLKNKNEDLIR